MSFLRRLARNSGLVMADQVTNALISFLFVAFVARRLGTDAFGVYMLAIAVVRFFSMLVNLGISPIALREIARDREQAGAVAGRFLALRLLLGTIAYGGLALFVAVAGYDPATDRLLLLLGLTLIAEAVGQTCADLFTGRERFARTAAVQIAAGAVNAGAGILALLAGAWGSPWPGCCSRCRSCRSGMCASTAPGPWSSCARSCPWPH